MTTRDDQQISQILAQMSATPAPAPQPLVVPEEDDALPVPPPDPSSTTAASQRRTTAAGTGTRARGRAKSDERLAMKADEWEQSRKLNHVRTPSLSLPRRCTVQPDTQCDRPAERGRTEEARGHHGRHQRPRRPLAARNPRRVSLLFGTHRRSLQRQRQRQRQRAPETRLLLQRRRLLKHHHHRQQRPDAATRRLVHHRTPTRTETHHRAVDARKAVDESARARVGDGTRRVEGRVLAFKRGRFFYGGSGSGSGPRCGGGGDAAAGSCEWLNLFEKRVETSGFFFGARGGEPRRRHHHSGSTRWRTETFTSVVVSAPTSSASTTFSDANADTSPFCSISGFQTTETRDRRSSSRSSSSDSDSGGGGRRLKRGSAFMREGHGWRWSRC